MAADSARIIQDESPERVWDAFLESKEQTGFMQSSWWAEFQERRGRRHFGVVLDDGCEIVGGARIIVQPFAPGAVFYYVPDGPVLPADSTDAADVFQTILDFVRERREAEPDAVSHLRLEPRWQKLPEFVKGFLQSREWMEPRDTLCVDLRRCDTELLGQMKPKGRYNIRVAMRHGVEVNQDNSCQGIRDFLAIYRDTCRRQLLNSKSDRYFQLLIPHLVSANRGSLFFAEHGGSRIATAFVIFWARRATYFFGGSLGRLRHLMAPYLLHYEIMRHARHRGCLDYDLYGIAPAHKADHPWANLSAFKRQFGGQEVSYVRTQDWVFDSAAYQGFVSTREARRQRRPDPS